MSLKIENIAIPSNWGGISLLEWRHFHEFKYVILHSEKSIRFDEKLKMNYDKKLESCKESIWSHSYIIGWFRRFMSHKEIIHRSCIWNSRPNITSKSWQTLVNQILYLMMSKILRKYGPVKHFLRLLQICNIFGLKHLRTMQFSIFKTHNSRRKSFEKKITFANFSNLHPDLNWMRFRNNGNKNSHQWKIKLLTSI